MEKVKAGDSGCGAEAGLRGGSQCNDALEQRLYLGDNLKLMKALAEDENICGKIQMIYIDPPFFTKADYDAVVPVGGKQVRHKAYEDRWHNGMYEYLRQLTARLLVMKKLLAEDGLIWVHLDWHAAHYVRIIMDEIFGENNFLNEIIWTYKSGGSSKRRFARKHDNILLYSKSSSYKFNILKEKSYNRGYKPYRFKGVKEYEDEMGWYTMVNMKDVWNVDMVGRTSAERTGYATQKPEKLLERIIEASTDPGELCADFFSGSGTLAAAAAKLGRRSISCDSGMLAVETTAGRLCRLGTGFSVYAGEKERWMRESASHFHVDLEISRERLLGPDAYLLSVTLKGVEEVSLGRNMEQKDRKLVRKTAKSDPLTLIELWSIDYDHDGAVHRPADVQVRTGGKIADHCEKILTADPERQICIKFVDLMGRVHIEKFREQDIPVK